MSNIKLKYYYKGEKRKNKGILRVVVIRGLLQLWKDFYPQFKSDHI